MREEVILQYLEILDDNLSKHFYVIYAVENELNIKHDLYTLKQISRQAGVYKICILKGYMLWYFVTDGHASKKVHSTNRLFFSKSQTDPYIFIYTIK